MKKEKTIRTYQRRTKTGKVVTVRQHKASYDAAEEARKAAKKKGAGDELKALKKTPKKDALTPDEIDEIETPIEDFRKIAAALGLTEREAASWIAGDDFSGYKKAHFDKGNRAAKKFLGADIYSKLDPNEADVPLAVTAKLGLKGYGGSKFMRISAMVKGTTKKGPKGN